MNPKPHLAMWLAALFASCILLLGWQSGFAVALLILVIRCALFFLRLNPSRVPTWSLVILPALFAAAFWYVDRNETERIYPANANLKGSLKQVVLSVLNYKSAHGKLPPAYLADENGKPMHSWRVLLLPFMDRQDLFDLYRLEEPWNSEHNLEVAKKLGPNILGMPVFGGADNQTASFQFVTGPGSAFVDAKQFEGELPSDYILMIENRRDPVLWTCPEDTDAKSAVALFDIANFNRDDGLVKSGFVSRVEFAQFLVGNCYGELSWACPIIEPKEAAGLFSLNGASSKSIDELQRHAESQLVFAETSWWKLSLVFAISFLTLSPFIGPAARTIGKSSSYAHQSTASLYPRTEQHIPTS